MLSVPLAFIEWKTIMKEVLYVCRYVRTTYIHLWLCSRRGKMKWLRKKRPPHHFFFHYSVLFWLCAAQSFLYSSWLVKLHFSRHRRQAQRRPRHTPPPATWVRRLHQRRSCLAVVAKPCKIIAQQSRSWIFTLQFFEVKLRWFLTPCSTNSA